MLGNEREIISWVFLSVLLLNFYFQMGCQLNLNQFEMRTLAHLSGWGGKWAREWVNIHLAIIDFCIVLIDPGNRVFNYNIGDVRKKFLLIVKSLFLVNNFVIQGVSSLNSWIILNRS